MMPASERRVPIRTDADILVARQQGRALAEQLGFTGSELTIIATAISEVARNIVEYARLGEMVMGPIDSGRRHGIVIVARDQGPGIPDILQALQDGFSTSGGLGMGLPGARRLMDDLEVISELGRGTTVVMKKWKI